MSTARTFSKVSPAIWRPGRFLDLSTTEAKLLYVYFLTCEHNNSAGCYRIPDGYACADLGWSVETYHAERQRLVEAGLVDFDPECSVVFIERWFKHNVPATANHKTGTRRIVENIESDRLREKAEAEFLAVTEGTADENYLANPLDKPSDRLTSTRFMNGHR